MDSILKWSVYHYGFDAVNKVKDYTGDFVGVIVGILICFLFWAAILPRVHFKESDKMEPLLVYKMVYNGYQKIVVRDRYQTMVQCMQAMVAVVIAFFSPNPNIEINETKKGKFLVIVYFIVIIILIIFAYVFVYHTIKYEWDPRFPKYYNKNA